MNYATITHKAGASFSLAGTCLLPAGSWDATCQARDKTTDALVQDFAVTLTPLGTPTAEASHAILIEAPASAAADWPVGQLVCDVRYTGPDALVLATSTFLINVVKRVTRDA